MSFAKGMNSNTLERKQNISDTDIVGYYLGVTKIPTRICSPLRRDNKPSFGLYTRDGEHIYYTDFATGDKGGMIDLLMQMWGTNYAETWNRIVNDLTFQGSVDVKKISMKPKLVVTTPTSTSIQVKVRDWRQYDFDYWKSYGISKEWLTFANVYPISHIIFTNKETKEKSAVKSDKLAYVFVEFKEGNTTFKVYQPLNTTGYKWFSSHDRSVISLWAKVPEYGDKLIICSSLKDALCLWSNTGIPCIAPQGEGYTMSDTAVSELKRRYKNVYILYDNDAAGEKDSNKFASLTGFTKITLPQFMGGKDVSDLYKSVGLKQFKEIIIPLIK